MRSEKELGEISDRLPDEIRELVLAFDGKGNIFFANRAAAESLKYQESELLKCNITQIFRQEFQTEAGGTVPFDIGRMKDGEETAAYLNNSACIPVRIKLFPMNAPGAFFLLAENISKQKEMTLKLQRLKEEEKKKLRERDEFTANVTHELRTPINGIRGHVETLLNITEDSEHRRILSIILDCCSNMSKIINNILDFSKLETGKFTVEEREFDFYEMMDKVVANHINEIKKKELMFSVDVDEQIPRLLVGDELGISQILNNLLSNAVKFTSIGYVSVVVNKISQNSDGAELLFMVKDSGIGIAKEELGRLFQSFSQADASITRRYGGTGLGLFIAKQLVDLMNGNIYVESEKGKGSVFSFRIRLKVGQSTEQDEKWQEVFNSWSNFVNEEKTEEEIGNIFRYGEKENLEELEKRMDKLALSIEMNIWDKAEFICNTIKILTDPEDECVKKQLLRLEMAIRKENYEKSMNEYEKLREMLKKVLN